MPFSLPEFWGVLLKYFPDARYIYMERSPAKWFNSLVRFHSKLAKFEFSKRRECAPVNVDGELAANALDKWHYRDRNQLEHHLLRYSLSSRSEVYNSRIYMAYQENHISQARNIFDGKSLLWLETEKLSSVETGRRISSFLNIPFDVMVDKINAT